MKCMHDIVIYDEKQEKALKLIKELDLSSNLYHKKRNLGMTPQEAFEHCLKVKKSPNEDISSTYLRKIGLPLEYNSLTDFCVLNKLNMSKIYKNIQVGLNLYDAVLNSFKQSNVSLKTKYIYLHIQFKSLAQKYRLDYYQLCFWLRKGLNYFNAIEREVFARTFSQNMGSRNNFLWNIYQNEFLKGIDIKDKITQEELNCFIICYARMKNINRDISYYEFLANINIEDYNVLNLDDRVQKFLLRCENIPYSLTELYYILDFENGLMSEFVYLEEKQIWVYNGNREVLKKLEKPSNN